MSRPGVSGDSGAADGGGIRLAIAEESYILVTGKIVDVPQTPETHQVHQPASPPPENAPPYCACGEIFIAGA